MHKKVDDTMYYIGLNIRAARRLADLTQEQLSESIGITPQHLSEIERGLVGTSVSTLAKICRKLNVSADFILFGDAGDIRNASFSLYEKTHSLSDRNAGIGETEADMFLGIPGRKTYGHASKENSDV